MTAMFGRTPKIPVRQPGLQTGGAGKNCCVRTMPNAQPAQRPVQRPVQRPNPFVKR
jgi:hypothetical protein